MRARGGYMAHTQNGTADYFEDTRAVRAIHIDRQDIISRPISINY